VSRTLDYKEVIRPPWWLVAFIYFMLLSLVIAIWAAFDNNAAINAFAISLALQAALVHWMTSTIEVEEGELRIKRAHIPLKYLGDIEVISKEKFGYERTRGADPAAFFAITFWISQGIKVAVKDDRDPTPYWLISTKRATELAAALRDSKKV
jgi:hypothetical protein